LALTAFWLLEIEMFAVCLEAPRRELTGICCFSRQLLFQAGALCCLLAEGKRRVNSVAERQSDGALVFCRFAFHLEFGAATLQMVAGKSFDSARICGV
jgi:hypothetical protein